MVRDQRARAGTRSAVSTTAGSADLRRAAIGSSMGSALEYYDLALYGLAAALVFGPLFFPARSATTGLTLSFATYFVGFAVRPIGGIVFGRLGDRLGRKFALMTTIVIMGVASTGIGLLPTYGDNHGDWYGSGVGVLAPILLIVLRIMQGLGAGAEMAGASVLMTEHAPPRRRGYYSSLPFMGVQLGTLAAALVYWVVFCGHADTTSTWLWRVPFLANVLIVGIAVYLRMNLKESPTFLKLEQRDQIAVRPLRELLTHSRPTLWRGIGLRVAENGSGSMYQALAVAYVTSASVGIKGPIGALSLVFAACLGAVMVPIAGQLSDRFGRVRIYQGFAVFQLVLAFPIWWGLSKGSVVTTIVVISVAVGIGTCGMFGAQSAFIAELFGARHRYIGVSLAREISAVIAGGAAPLIGAWIIARVVAFDGGPDVPGAGLGAWVFLAGYLCLLTLVTIATTFVTPDPADRDLDDPCDAVDASVRHANARPPALSTPG